MTLWPFVLRSTYDALASRADAYCQEINSLTARLQECHNGNLRTGESLAQRDATIRQLTDECNEAMRLRDGYRELLHKRQAEWDEYRTTINIHESTIATLRKYLIARDQEIERMDTESHRLRLTIATMSTELAALKAAQPAPPKTPRRSKLTEAIREQATLPDGSIDPRLLNHFRARANQLRRQGMKEGEICESISVWNTSERSESALTVDAIVQNFSTDAVP